MTTVYIVSDFGRLVKSGYTLQLRREGDIIKTIFPFKTKKLVIIGRIDITSSALRVLMHNNIDTVFLGTNGRFNGKLVFQEGKNVFLRKRQYELLEDHNFKLNFAKAIIKGKIHNQRSFIQRLARSGKRKDSFSSHISKMKDMILKLESAESLDQLRGYEGYAAKTYFDAFQYTILPEWAHFNGRSMHPPRDNVNAVLSFLYTMILFRVDAALSIDGLDPYVGYLHTIDYGKRSLTFDLMEEYRTPLGDALTASLFNLGVLTPDDFEETIFSTESDKFPLTPELSNSTDVVSEETRGVLLNKMGLKKVIGGFEKKLESRFYYDPLLKKLSYKQFFHEQIKHFKRVLTGEESIYKPLTIK